jgi:tetratricopeptide (TPR) repeat protein
MTRQARPLRRWLGAGVVVVAFAALVPLVLIRPSHPPAPAPALLRADWGGCDDVRLRDDVPLCLVDPERPLHLWIEDPRAERVEVVVDGKTVAAERHTIDGEPGQGLRVRVPAGAAELVIRVVEETSIEPMGSLALAAMSTDPPSATFRKALREIKRAFDEDDVTALERAVERAFGLALADGRLRDAVDLGLGLVFQLDQLRLHPELAAALLQLVEDAAARYPKGRGDLACYRGLHLWYQGAVQEAAESLRDAARIAVRLEDEVLAAESIPMYAEALAQLGYFEDARRWAREGLRLVRQGEQCDIGSVLRTVGWLNLRLRQRGHPHDDPVPILEEALQVFGAGGTCPRPDKLGGARLSLALLALDEGRLDDAASQLEQIDRDTVTLDERVYVDDIEVRLSLARAEDPTRRWQAYRRLQLSVRATDTADARWRLHTRLGLLLERDGYRASAVDAYRVAERELDALVRLQAVGIGRGQLADRYHESTAALVSLLVERGAVDEAWCIARQEQARRRTVALTAFGVVQPPEIEEKIQRYRREKLAAETLEVEAHGLPRDEAQSALRTAAELHGRARGLANELMKTGEQLTPRCSELSAPGVNELLLGLYPRERDWLVFASDELETTVHSVPTPHLDERPEALAAALLEPLGSRLAAAGRVRVLAHREAQRIEVDRLPWCGEPLGARLPVSYGVELPVQADPAALAYRALLLADPTATLEGAEVEVELIDERLIAAGWSTSVGGSSEPGMVSPAGYDLFHYAGHAEASERPEHGGWPPYPGGDRGFAAFLELGFGGRLTAHDVMATRAAPRTAVLAGCRTGALDLDTGQTSMALAFLVAGAEQVVASAEKVQDARGAGFARGFYEALVHEPGVDLVLAMQQAQRELLEAGEEMAGYRVWVR